MRCAVNWELAQAPTFYEAAHQFEIDQGMHSNRVMDRSAAEVLPFLSTNPSDAAHGRG